jgi:hypothetical protein
MVFTDGLWVLLLGSFGLIGFVNEFGLLALPIYRAARAVKFAQSLDETVFLAALALIMAINLIDLLPNSTLTPWTWLLAGALLGRAEELQVAQRRLRVPKRRESLFLKRQISVK